jgi:hypothetical protein
LTFSLNHRIDRADRTTPLSNVSVTNEIVAARRLFRRRHINFDGREKTFYVIDLCCAGSWPGVAPGMIAPVRRTAGKRAAPEAFASGETGR